MADKQRSRGRATGRASRQAGGQAPTAPRPPAPERTDVPQYEAAPSSSAGRAGARPVRHEAVSVPPVASMRGLRLDEGAGGEPARGAGDRAGAGRGTARGRRDLPQAVYTRPASLQTKQGKGGDVVRLQANYFQLATFTDWSLYQYRVDFNPDEDRTFERKRLLAQHRSKLQGYMFDGTVLWTSYRLNPEPMELVSKREGDDQIFNITIKLTTDLVQGDPGYLQVFNVILRKCLQSLDLQLVKRDYFDAKAKIDIPDYKMELWPGYRTSIRQHESSILLGVEIITKVMRRDTAYHLLSTCVERNRQNWKDAFQSAIIGSVVLTDYNNRTYTIDDVDFDSTPRSTFDKKDGKISYVEYYKSRYQINIQMMDQPLLISRAKARDIRRGMAENIILIPELCRLTGYTDEMRNDFQLTSALAKYTRVDPAKRIDSLIRFSNRLNSCPRAKEELSSWNLSLSNRPVEFNGRVLPQEKILLGNSEVKVAGPTADWTSAFRSSPLFAGAQMTNWVVLCPSKNRRDLGNFLSTLVKANASFRFAIPQPAIEELPDDRASTYTNVLDVVIARKNPQMIMCIVPNNRAERYAAIKKKCYIDRAVPCQVVLAKQISKSIMAVCTKIGIQINCKIGGAPWSVQNPLAGLMVVGYDVNHDTGSKARSFGALVASLNRSLSTYYSAVAPHSNGEELSNELSLQLVCALNKYRLRNNALPSFIVIYRDGVGDGQVPFVYTHEVQLVLTRMREVYQGQQQPKVAFVVVTKKINTRLFLRGGNPDPGTVADDCVTFPDRYDFFLVSQSVKQGTVSPTSFNVLYDDTGLPPDKMQKLAYKMTHMYYNWSGTVRVPAPCQYAHKLAFLTGQTLHRSPNPGLEELLYYL